MSKINLKDYYYHGFNNDNYLENVLKYGILSREKQQKIGYDNFNSSSDYISKVGLNGLSRISISLYDTLSFYIFNMPTITFILSKDIDIINDNSLLFDGEKQVNDIIKLDKIIGIGCIVDNFKLLDNSNYKNDMNLINYIKRYIKLIYLMDKLNIDLPIYDLRTGELVQKKFILEKEQLIKKNRIIKIVFTGTIYTGKNELIQFIEKDLKANYDIILLDSNIRDFINSSDYATKKNLLYEQYLKEQNIKYLKRDSIIIYKNSILDYQLYISNSDWNKIIKELKINTNDTLNSYNIVFNLESMIMKYNNKFFRYKPNIFKELKSQSKKIDKIYSNHLYYFNIKTTETINEKVTQFYQIINKYLNSEER